VTFDILHLFVSYPCPVNDPSCKDAVNSPVGQAPFIYDPVTGVTSYLFEIPLSSIDGGVECDAQGLLFGLHANVNIAGLGEETGWVYGEIDRDTAWGWAQLINLCCCPYGEELQNQVFLNLDVSLTSSTNGKRAVHSLTRSYNLARATLQTSEDPQVIAQTLISTLAKLLSIKESDLRVSTMVKKSDGHYYVVVAMKASTHLTAARVDSILSGMSDQDQAVLTTAGIEHVSIKKLAPNGGYQSDSNWHQYLTSQDQVHTVSNNDNDGGKQFESSGANLHITWQSGATALLVLLLATMAPLVQQLF
jgi:hypothetical protein